MVPVGDDDALASYARELGCDILITGHTHKLNLKNHDGKLLVNPGSVTGALSGYDK